MTPADHPSPEPGGQPRQLSAGGVDALLQRIASAANIPGISIAVAAPDRVLYVGAVGYADLAQRRQARPEDQYLWFSMTKIATATAAIKLHADGRPPRPRRSHRHLPARLPAAPEARPPHHTPVCIRTLPDWEPAARTLGPPRASTGGPGFAHPHPSQARHAAQEGRHTGRLLKHRLLTGRRGYAGRYWHPG